MSITQRISDYLRERRIRRLQQRLASAYDIADRRRLWIQLQDQIKSRSPDQVRRMERNRGIHHA